MGSWIIWEDGLMNDNLKRGLLYFTRWCLEIPPFGGGGVEIREGPENESYGGRL